MTQSGVILFDGDSVSAGKGASAEQFEPRRQLRSKLRQAARMPVIAVSGHSVSQRLAKYEAQAAPHYDATAPFNIIAFHAGDNDVKAGRTAQQVYATLTDYIGLAHGQGWKVVLSTELDRPDWADGPRNILLAYNALMLQNAAGADAVVDFARAPGMEGNRAGSGFYHADQVHPSDRGYAVLAQLLAGAIETLIG